MADEVRPEVIKKTQEVLGKFIKKPTLTEKLLKKPPFRFLHDICTSVMKETGFFEQVLGQEDKIENIKDKEGKIEFLQKVIEAVEAANGIKLAVKPNKVVAGLEATKTNEFLQALGKAIEKQQVERKSSKTTLHAKSKSTNKTGKEAKEEPPDKKKTSSRSSKKTVENGVNESSESRSKPEVQPPASPKKKHSSKKSEQASIKDEGDKLEEEKSKNDLTEEQGREERRDVKRSAHGGGESKELQDVNVIKVNGVDGQGDQNPVAKEEIAQGGEQSAGHSGKHKHRRTSISNVPDQAKTVEASDGNENSGRQRGGSGDSIANDKINLQNKSELQNKTTPSSSGQINYSKNGPNPTIPKKPTETRHYRRDTSLVREGTIISRPRTGIRPTTTRPASARPAAPRIRDRGDVAVSEEVIKPASGKVQVIVDEETVNEADDDNLISLETPNDIAVEETKPVVTQGNATTEQEHGHLVEQILEAQRELEDDARFSDQKETGKTEIEWEAGKNRESVNREIEKLRTNIQNLTRTANPLGKLLEFFQEDIEIVQKELESWKGKNASYCLQIAQEKSITDQYVEPLKIHLKDLQKSIDEELEQISMVKANIIRNNEKIHRLLSGL